MGQKILVVEDNELNLKLFCDLLRAHGYETEPVRDGRDALDRARAFVPDLVVMDIQMPYVSGLELIEQMKADDGLKRTPIMAVTAYAARGDEERIRDAGAEGYVSKPISVVKFVAAVAGLLAAAAGTAEPGGESEAEVEKALAPGLSASETPGPAPTAPVVQAGESVDPVTESIDLSFDRAKTAEDDAGGSVPAGEEIPPASAPPEGHSSSDAGNESGETEGPEREPGEGPAPAA